MALKIRTGPKQNLAITSPRNMPTRTATGAGVRLIAFSTLLEERLCRLSLSFMWQGRQLAIQNLCCCGVLCLSIPLRDGMKMARLLYITRECRVLQAPINLFKPDLFFFGWFARCIPRGCISTKSEIIKRRVAEAP